ncbi:hypothetical protein IPN35_00445 [Candidatus Peregrinibacteria bacterium]|nr:MAG: hypothetical protein IPN35_00445 [Candidatus Peregrinibacteria bacterium]
MRLFSRILFGIIFVFIPLFTVSATNPMDILQDIGRSFSLPTMPSGENGVLTILLLIIEFLLGIFSLFLTVSALWAGFLFLTSFGEEERITRAKKLVIWMFVGVAATALSYVFIRGVILLFS